MRRALAALLLAALGALAAPGAASAQLNPACDPACTGEKLAAGTLSHQTVVAPDGLVRTFRLFEPAGLPADQPIPVLLALHGGGGDGTIFADATNLDAIAAREGFVVAYPDGLSRTWNAGHCCLAPYRAGVDDVGFLEEVVRFVQARHSIDPRRVFVTGHSNGGMMAYHFACESALPAAIAVVAGTSTTACRAPNLPVSLLHIHGTEDENVPFEGGAGSRSTGEHPPVRPVIDGWRERNGCSPAVITDTGALHSERSDCVAGSAVDLVLIAGADHAWPGSPARNSSALIGGTPSQALDASEAVWEFLSAHPRPAG